MDRIISKLKTAIILPALLLVFTSQGFSQCPTANDFEIGIENNNRLTIIFSNSSSVLNGLEFTLYNYDNANNYKEFTFNERSTSDLLIDKVARKIVINNIPEGDYLLIVENAACDKIFVGEGFSGFPYSGLRFE